MPNINKNQNQLNLFKDHEEARKKNNNGKSWNNDLKIQEVIVVQIKQDGSLNLQAKNIC